MRPWLATRQKFRSSSYFRDALIVQIDLLNYFSGQYKMQTTDRLQIADWV